MRITAVLALGLSLLLAGCFISDRPMFSPASALQPLAAGRYGLFEQYGDQTKPSEYMEVKLRPDGVYDFINEKGAVNPVPVIEVAATPPVLVTVNDLSVEDVKACGPKS